MEEGVSIRIHNDVILMENFSVKGQEKIKKVDPFKGTTARVTIFLMLVCEIKVCKST